MDDAPAIGFRRLLKADFYTLSRWHSSPHLIEWWGERKPEQVVVRYGEKLTQPWLRMFIVTLEARDIGFIQTYHAPFVGNGWWPEEIEGTWGIDQFIGEQNLLGQGIGSAFVRRFSDDLLQDPAVKKIITDPSLVNLRAIRAYEKAGFLMVGPIDTPDGKELLMEKWRA